MIIDAHTHIGKIVLAGVGRADPQNLNVDYETRLEVMDKNDIDRAVIMPTLTYKKEKGAESTRELNDAILEISESHDKFACPIGTVEPSHGDKALEELERISDLGFRGVVWHHRFQGNPIDDPTTIKCLKRLEDLDIIGMLRCLPSSELEDLRRIDNVAGCTTQPLIVLSTLSDYGNVDFAIDLGKRYENLYFETANLTSTGMVIERMVDELGAEKIIFGTDLYTRPLTYKYSPSLFQIRKSDISDEEKEAILGENAQSLFSI